MEKDKIQKALDGNFIMHTVASTDTLQGVALKYGVTVSKIFNFNLSTSCSL